MNFLLPTFDVLVLLYFQLQLHVMTHFLPLQSQAYFTNSPLDQIADQSITCLIHYIHPWGMLQLLALPPQEHHHMTSLFTSNFAVFRQIKLPKTSEKKIKLLLKEESHKNSFVLTVKLAPKHKKW